MGKKAYLSDYEFSKMVERASRHFFQMYNYIMQHDPPYTRKCYATITHVAEPFESFLDEHGARANKSWVFLTELVASIRNISIAAFHLRHLLNRYKFYKLDETEMDQNEFRNEAEKTMAFFFQSITTLYKTAKAETDKFNIKITDESFTEEDFKDAFIDRYLKDDADDEIVENSEEKIIDFSRRYRKAAKLSREENIDYKFSPEEIAKRVPLKINENKMQKLNNIIHGVQSDYDTYVKGTKIEKTNENFHRFRGYISIPLHLQKIIIMLCHFFERHENEIRQGGISGKSIAQLVDKDIVLDRAINFGFYYCNKYLQAGNELAESLLSLYVIKEQYRLPIPKPLGFHARPATYVSLIVNEHGTEVSLIADDKKFNAKSVLSLMEAGGVISDKGLTDVIFEGDKRVLDDIRILAKNNYCEDKPVPRELNYLRILRNVG